ncbi:reverse transcriptase domain-containing protein [Tanacetum coccineum]
MPFGLKNDGATYQRLVDKAFDSQVGRNIEVYVDDLVIKSHTETEILRDIDETFRTLRKINMKLNPKKQNRSCVATTTRKIKEDQSLNGKLASLSRFLSKSAENSLPLFKTLKKCIKKSDFHWTPEAEQAFKQLKQHLSELPMLVAPKPKEELIVYLSASHGAISAVLMTERDKMGVRNMHVSVDSKLVANQVLGTYVAKEENMIKYLEKVKSLVSGFSNFSISQVPRSKNKKADALSKICATTLGVFHQKTVDRGESRGDNHRQSSEKFVWDNIVCCFGLPGEIVSDNGKQLSDNPFKDWCEKLNITQRFTSVKHPQSNGLVERANRSLGEGIKARLGERNKNWIEELPHVLWAHRTMIKSSHVDAVHNDEELRLNLDLLEERRERATIGEAKAKLKMTKYYNARVRGVTFRPGDFVYRSNDVDGGKLGPKWEGPYEVMEALRDGTHAKVYGWNSPSADVEHHQSQEMLSLSYDMDEFAL